MKTLSFATLIACLMVIGCNKTDDTTAASGSPATTPAASSPATTPATSDSPAASPSADASPSASGGTTAQAGGVTEADLGVAFYPGSTEKPNMSAKAEVGGKATATAVRSTKDAPEKVVAFYKDAITKAGYTVQAATTANGVGSVVGMKGQDTISVAVTKDTTGGDGNMVTVVNSKSK